MIDARADKGTDMERKNSERNSDPKLTPQPGGRGALLSGGKPGNKGGGRPRNELRGLLRQDLESAQRQLRERLDAGTLKVPEIFRYIEFALRYTLPIPKEGYDSELIADLWRVTEAELTRHEEGAVMADKVQQAWVPVLAARVM